GAGEERSSPAPQVSARRGRRSVVGDGDRDVDVAAGGVGVRAYPVGLVGQRVSLGLDEVREGDLEFDGELEAALVVLADAHAGADRGIIDIRLGLTRHETQRRVEAGRVTDREELLGIRAVAAAAHVRGGGEIDIDLPVTRATVAVAAFAGGQCFCGVEGPHDSSFRRWCAAGPVRGRARSRDAGQRWVIAVGPAEAAVSSSTAGRSTLLSTSVTARSADRIRPS